MSRNHLSEWNKEAPQMLGGRRRIFVTILTVLFALAAICILAVLASLSYLWVQSNQIVILPRPTGPYAVGRAGFDWTDSNRLETLGPGQSGYRELMVWIWYPAVPTPGSQTTEYLPETWRQARESDLGIAGAWLRQNAAAVRVHSVADAPIASSGHPYPILVMQPGLGPIASDYTVLAEDLASHGYVVVASTPTYSANVVVFQDGRVANRSRRGTIDERASPEALKAVLDNLLDVWAADDIFIMNQLELLNRGTPASAFDGHLDLKAIGVWGHSFGGASAAQTCRLDDRCTAGADLDGTLYGDAAQSKPRRPFMFIWSDSQDTPHAGPPFDNSASGPNIYQVTIKGTRHFNFADYAVLNEPALRLLNALGPIDGQRGLRITADFLVAFFDRYLKGTASPLLGGSLPAYPDVRFQAH
jgi:dienelactone hydrolase